jgi:secernin
MCDTFVALPAATATGSVLLAKNADTEINEAQHVLKLPRRTYPEGGQVRITHRLIPQARQTHEVLIDKSFWTYGGEIAVNEHGLAIGNEAVFSTLPPKGDGVILIDLLRLIAERAKDRHEAVELAGHLLGVYGQGGNCELRGNSHFDGSFIIADKSGAIVFETAGTDWAMREVDGFATISNGYTIHTDWNRSSLVAENGLRYDFGSAVADGEHARQLAAQERQQTSHDFLAARIGKVTVRSMATLLRHTGEDIDYEPMKLQRPTLICMHAAPYDRRFFQSTGALISDTRGDDVMAWVTATSGTDLSIFKPVYFGVDLPDLGPMPCESYTPGSYWWRHELLHRRVMSDYTSLAKEIRENFESLENSFFEHSETVRKGTSAEKASFVKECWRLADEAEANWISKLAARPYVIENREYRKMWDDYNRAASLSFD